MQPTETISETYHPDAIAEQGRVRYVSVGVIITAFTVGAGIVSLVTFVVDAPILTGLVIYALIAGAIFLAALSSRFRQVAQATERTIVLANGQISITTETETESYPFESCCWFRGMATDDSKLTYQPIRAKAIIIVFPTGRTIACGFSDTFYSRWLDALRVHRCRQVLRQEGAMGVLFGLLVVIGLAAGAFIGWRIGGILQNILAPVPANNQFPNLIPTALAILLAWSFTILPWFIPGWRRYTSLERQQLTRSAILFPGKVAFPVAVFVSGNVATGIVLALFFAVLFLGIAYFVTQQPESTATRNAA